MSADQAAAVLHRGGLIAYPTEGVFGLGCLPGNAAAVERLLEVKQRDPAKGLILLAANAKQLEGWINLAEDQSLPAPNLEKPITWIVAAGEKVLPIVRGAHTGIAVRITSNPVAKSVCLAADSPIVSTSANLSGQPVAENQAELRRQFEGLVDYVVAGDCGPFSKPSEIRNLASGEILRPH